ncbi:MAG: FliH/SctL family protein [Pseudothermotoga sp.]
MIIKKRQLFIDSPYIANRVVKPTEDPAELLKKAEQQLKEAQEQAKKIVESAQLQAQSIVDEAKEQANKIVESAKKESLAIQNQIKTSTELLEKIVKKFNEELRSKTTEISNSLSEAVFLLVKKITYREIDKVDYQKRIEEILTRIVGMNNVKVTVNQSDFEAFPQMMEKLKTMGIEVVKSAKLQRGDILVDTEFGVIDATQGYLLKVIDQLFEEVFGSE